MKKLKVKKLILTVLCVLVALALIFLVLNLFNFRKFYSCEENGYSFIFRGSIGNVKKVIIKKDGKKLSSLKFSGDKAIFENYKIIFADANADGAEDILLPTHTDADGDTYFSLYLAADNGFIRRDDTSALPFVDFSESGELRTEYHEKLVTEEAQENAPEGYTTTHAIERYAFVGDKFILMERRAVIYYSENDYYCYSTYAYNEESDEFEYIDEDWFSPDELENYPLSWN